MLDSLPSHPIPRHNRVITQTPLDNLSVNAHYPTSTLSSAVTLLPRLYNVPARIISNLGAMSTTVVLGLGARKVWMACPPPPGSHPRNGKEPRVICAESHQQMRELDL